MNDRRTAGRRTRIAHCFRTGGRYTSFSFGGETIRFLTSPQLVRYETVKKCNNGYIEVDAIYGDRKEEGYIDFVPILKNLYIDPESFLKGVKRVEVVHD